MLKVTENVWLVPSRLAGTGQLYCCQPVLPFVPAVTLTNCVPAKLMVNASYPPYSAGSGEYLYQNVNVLPVEGTAKTLDAVDNAVVAPYTVPLPKPMPPAPASAHHAATPQPVPKVQPLVPLSKVSFKFKHVHAPLLQVPGQSVPQPPQLLISAPPVRTSQPSFCLSLLQSI